MKRVRVYNNKGAKFTTTSEEAIARQFIPVEAVELLRRLDVWKRKMSMATGMKESMRYYDQKELLFLVKV